MKPFYTIDAGEFLVASHIERALPGISIWFPTKDEGDDLLLLNRSEGTFCTVQIKVSRDYLSTHMDTSFHARLKCCGWFTPFSGYAWLSSYPVVLIYRRQNILAIPEPHSKELLSTLPLDRLLKAAPAHQ